MGMYQASCECIFSCFIFGVFFVTVILYIALKPNLDAIDYIERVYNYSANGFDLFRHVCNNIFFTNNSYRPSGTFFYIVLLERSCKKSFLQMTNPDLLWKAFCNTNRCRKMYKIILLVLRNVDNSLNTFYNSFIKQYYFLIIILLS